MWKRFSRTAEINQPNQRNERETNKINEIFASFWLNTKYCVEENIENITKYTQDFEDFF